jgi:hypothetical protein
MATPVIKTAAASDEAHVIDVLVRAFAADPAARWGWPEQQQQYYMHFPSFVRAFGGKAFTHRSPYYIEGFRVLFQLLRIYNDARKKRKKKQGFMAAVLYWPYP